MKSRLVIDGNTVYEVDEEALEEAKGKKVESGEKKRYGNPKDVKNKK